MLISASSLQLSPSFTPTSVIRKMYESREKTKEEMAPGMVVPGDGKEDTQKTSEGTAAYLCQNIGMSDCSVREMG